MKNFDVARRHMVDSQIHPAGVISEPVLEAFRSVPRELFVPEHLRGLVYADKDLPLGEGYFLMEPAIFARMIEASNIRGNDHILNVGDATGYSTAVLSAIAKTVTTPEKMIQGEMFSLIFLNGAVETMPGMLMDSLAIEGRIIGVVRPEGGKIGTVTLSERIGDKHYSTRKLFEAGTPYMPGFEPRPGFKF